MTFTPKLIALDIDGTIVVPHPLNATDPNATDSSASHLTASDSSASHLSRSGQNGFSPDVVSSAVRDAIDRALAAGCHIVLASGRAPLSMSTVLGHLEMPRDGGEALGVASNGAVVFSFPPLKVVSEVTFDAREAVTAVLEHVPEAAVAVEEHGVGYRVNRSFPHGELDGEMILTPIEEMIASEVSRVIIRDPDSTSEDFVTLAHKLGLQGTNYFIGWTAWLDLAPEGVSKASGLAQVAEHLGVAREHVLAIGDGRNDVEMLEWAGRGVAMGQAPDEVKAIADDVAPSVYDDGCAVEISRWF